MKKRVVINGFGRIGRSLLREILHRDEFEVVCVNDIYDTDMMKYLFKHDSVYGGCDKEISHIKFTSGDMLKNISLSEIDLVFECSGAYLKKEELQRYTDSGADKVLLSAYSSELPVFIMGFNEKRYNNEKIVSASSCTANCVVPVLNEIDNMVGIKKCHITSIHSYTSEQNLLDGKSSDIRRSRAAPSNIIPIKSNMENTVTRMMASLKGKIKSKSIRVPVIDGVLIDMHIELKKELHKDETEALIKNMQDKKIYVATDEKPVSSDIISMPYSSVIDSELICIAGGDFLRVVAWQDNEYGYVKGVYDLSRVVLGLSNE